MFVKQEMISRWCTNKCRVVWCQLMHMCSRNSQRERPFCMASFLGMLPLAYLQHNSCSLLRTQGKLTPLPYCSDLVTFSPVALPCLLQSSFLLRNKLSCSPIRVKASRGQAHCCFIFASTAHHRALVQYWVWVKKESLKAAVGEAVPNSVWGVTESSCGILGLYRKLYLSRLFRSSLWDKT